ncbi:hypothetical protein BH11MYX2_BH11MYX2_00280 [soil metagenome]
MWPLDSRNRQLFVEYTERAPPFDRLDLMRELDEGAGVVFTQNSARDVEGDRILRVGTKQVGVIEDRTLVDENMFDAIGVCQPTLDNSGLRIV